MRFGEECPYITPCGWCSRKGTVCNAKNRRKKEPGVFHIPAPPPPEKSKADKRSEK